MKYCSIASDNADYGQGFEILNPPVIPVNGDNLNFEWESYLSDPKQIKRIKTFLENDSFIAEVVSKKYSPKETEMMVVLRADAPKALAHGG